MKNTTLPETPRQLRRMLARRLGAAAIVIGLLAGGVSYLLETTRTEKAALEWATASARHFEQSAMQMALAARLSEEHGALRLILDRTRFVGIRVFSPGRTLIYETWEDIPAALVTAAKSRQHDWPERGKSHQSWIEVGDERLIQVVLPLSGTDGSLAGYV